MDYTVFKCLCQVCSIQFHSNQLDKCAELHFLSDCRLLPVSHKDTYRRNSTSFFYVIVIYDKFVKCNWVARRRQ